MEKPKVLFISQEISPYLPETHMSVRGRMIPTGVQENGYEVRTFMPKYGCINERRNQLHEVIRLSGMNLIIDDSDHPLIIKVATLQPTRMQVYFIDNDDYFSTSPVKDLEINLSPADNDERTMFYVRGVVETVKKLRWAPAIIHCSGWISALAPLYLKRMYADDPAFRDAKIVYSITDPATLPENLDERFVEKLLMDGTFSKEDVEALGEGPVGIEGLTRLAARYADGIIAAHPDLAPEIIEAAKESGKPFLDYTDSIDEAVAKYIDFYKQL
ncbi:MAG: glycogen synthase [Bacteroidales bacterium]|nr:glycogen synthase [Bacteroidales bacterium]